MDLYDEFGNYIGPDIDDEDDNGSEIDNHVEPHFASQSPVVDPLNSVPNHADEDADRVHSALISSSSPMVIDGPSAASSAIILHEDKKYYPSAEEVYGPDVETLVQDEDTQPLSVPVIAPPKVPKTHSLDTTPTPAAFSTQFLASLQSIPSHIRNLCVIGHLHHGKTWFMDLLISSCHNVSWQPGQDFRYTDTHTLERLRGVSIKSTPMSLILQDLKGKSWLINLMDTPGHVNFSDEVTAAIRISDGAVLVVDVVEGVMVGTEKLIRHCVAERIPITLVVNKLDRLILELKLPPVDAYFKLKHTIEEVNSVMSQCPEYTPKMRVSPELDGFDFDEFAKRLWGDIYFDGSKRSFLRKPISASSKRTFVHFILEPLYKLYTQVLGEDNKALQSSLLQLGIHMKASQLSMDVKPLLTEVCAAFFGNVTAGFVEMVVRNVQSPVENAQKKVMQIWTGSVKPEDEVSEDIRDAMLSCDPKGPLMIHVVKSFNSVNMDGFEVFGRVMSGTVRDGMSVRVLGERYSPEDEEDMVVKDISGLSVYQSRYKMNVPEVGAGNWVLLSGVDASIVKTATITDVTPSDDNVVHIFKPL
ncbi:hypothetical protein HDU82_001139, partial [Entophlyctis luteolus]